MPESFQITCVTKSDRLNPHERITHVGGVANGKRWKITQEQAIDYIKRRVYQFWVSAGGQSVWVEVATSRYGNEYLKTLPDGEQPNNLLSLPECPFIPFS